MAKMKNLDEVLVGADPTSSLPKTLTMSVEVTSSYAAVATCRGGPWHGDSSVIEHQVAIEVARKLGVPPERLSFDIYRSFEGGPTQVTYGWRYVVPPTWEEIVTEMEAKYARSVG